VRARPVGRGTRLALGLQTVLALLLAVGAAVLAIDLSDWRYARFDLSASGRNTLDDAIRERIENLPEPAVVDVFFRPLRPPYDAVSSEVQGRMLELLFVAANAHRARFRVEVHDPTDLERTVARQAELGVHGINRVVVSCGSRRAELGLFDEIGDVAWGVPDPRDLEYLAGQGIAVGLDPRTYDPLHARFEPARVVGFHGGDALALALAKVSTGSPPRVLFATGHGEPDLDGELEGDLGSLRAALERDGFRAGRWDFLVDPAVPEGTDVLAILGPRQPLQPLELEAVRAWVDAGGRLLAALSPEEAERGFDGGLADLLARYGMLVRPGLVCLGGTSPLGARLEGSDFATHLVLGEGGLDASHPVTEPLRRRGRRLQVSLSPSFDLGPKPDGVLAWAIVTSPPGCWRDLPDDRGAHDYRYDARSEGPKDRFPLVVAASLASNRLGPDPREGRVLGVATVHAFANLFFESNRDFALNAFNWLAEREYRIGVTPEVRQESVLDVARGSSFPRLTWGLGLGLPLLAATVGMLVAWRRRTA